MKNLLLGTLFLLGSLTAFASDDDHPAGKITGDGIELSTIGHSIAGRIGDKLVIGDVSTAGGHKASTLVLKSHAPLSRIEFSNVNGEWGGTMSAADRSAVVKFVGLDRATNTYKISVRGKEYNVRVESEDFRNNHFINPTYILETEGKEIRAHMDNGQACYMYSLHLIFMIFGTYLF